MEKNRTYFTRQGMLNLEAKFEEHEEKTKNLLRELGEACRDDPDLPENLTSKEIRGRFHSEIPAEKRRLLEMRDSAVVVEDSKELEEIPSDVVWIGSEVEFCDVTDEKTTDKILILGALESDPDNDIISYEAPLAQAMIGKKAGDTFSLKEGPNFKIISVKRIL